MNTTSLLGATGAPAYNFESLTIGVVVETEDPEALGRVKVRLPVLGETFVTDWLRVTSVAAGPGYGVFFHPHEQDEVLVAFLHGNPNQAVVVGLLWNGRDRPPVAGEEQQWVSTIHTKGGNRITFRDGTDSGSVTVSDARDNQIVIDTATGKITITAKGDITMTTNEGSLELVAGDISLNAKGSATINAEELNLKGTATVNVNGGMIRLN